MSTFKINQAGVDRAVRGALERKAAQVQQVFDGVFATHRGKPVTEVKDRLKAAWRATGGTLDEPALTTYAQAISDGTKIDVQVKLRR